MSHQLGPRTLSIAELERIRQAVLAKHRKPREQKPTFLEELYRDMPGAETARITILQDNMRKYDKA